MIQEKFREVFRKSSTSSTNRPICLFLQLILNIPKQSMAPFHTWQYYSTHGQIVNFRYKHDVRRKKPLEVNEYYIFTRAVFGYRKNVRPSV